MDNDWRPTSELHPTAGMHINVRTVSITTYRWKPYKPDGARQMGVKGRWQRVRERGGWENAKMPPDAEWVPNRRCERRTSLLWCCRQTCRRRPMDNDKIHFTLNPGAVLALALTFAFWGAVGALFA